MARNPDQTRAKADEPIVEPAEAAALQAQILALRDEIARIAETLSGMGQTAAEGLRDRLKSGAETLRAEAEAEAGRVKERAGALAGEMTDYARDKPVHAMALAAAGGLVLGLLIGRR